MVTGWTKNCYVKVVLKYLYVNAVLHKKFDFLAMLSMFYSKIPFPFIDFSGFLLFVCFDVCPEVVSKSCLDFSGSGPIHTKNLDYRS